MYFYSLPSKLCTLISFPCFVALTKVSKIMLNKCDTDEYHYVFHNFKEDMSLSPPFRMNCCNEYWCTDMVNDIFEYFNKLLLSCNPGLIRPLDYI